MKPTPAQLNAAKKQWENSPEDEELDEKQRAKGIKEGDPEDLRADKPRIMRLAKAMANKKPKGVRPMQEMPRQPVTTGSGRDYGQA